MDYDTYKAALGDEEKTMEFRKIIGPRMVFSDERQHQAVRLSRDAVARGEFELAEVWAIRALNDGPSVDALCLLGDICQDTGDLDSALHWYELACACTAVRRFDDSKVAAGRQARLQAIRREIREEWEHRIPLREINFQAPARFFARCTFGEVVESKRDDDADSVAASLKILVVDEEKKLSFDFIRTVVLDDDLEFISFAPDLKLPHEPNLPHAMWVLPVHQVPEFGDVLLLSPRAAKAAAQATSRSTFLKQLPEGAKFGAFTGVL